MSLILDLLKYFMMGLGVFIFIPVIASLLSSTSVGKGIIDEYHGLAMTLLGRALLLQRSHGSLKLKKSTFDPKFAAERIRIKGQPRYFYDPNNLMSTFKNRSFGLAHEDRAVVVDARTAYFGRRFAELHNAGKLQVKDHIKAYFAVPEGLYELVDLRDVKAIIQNPGAPGLADRIDSYAEKGQSLFNSGTVMQQMQLFMALGVGFGLMWFAAQIQQTGAGEVGSTLPIFLGWF